MGSGMDVDARSAVGVFGHDAGNQGNALFKKMVGYPVDRDGVKPRIAEYDLIKAHGRGVPFTGRANVFGQLNSNLLHLFAEIDGGFCAPLLAEAAGLFIANTVVTNSQGNLLGEDLKEFGDFLAEMVAQINFIHPLLNEITRIENTKGPMKKIDNGFPGRDGFQPDVIKAIIATAGQHQFIDNPRDLTPKFPGGFSFNVTLRFLQPGIQLSPASNLFQRGILSAPQDLAFSSQKGDIFLSFSMMGGMVSTTKSISFAVL